MAYPTSLEHQLFQDSVIPEALTEEKEILVFRVPVGLGGVQVILELVAGIADRLFFSVLLNVLLFSVCCILSWAAVAVLLRVAALIPTE